MDKAINKLIVNGNDRKLLTEERLGELLQTRPLTPEESERWWLPAMSRVGEQQLQLFALIDVPVCITWITRAGETVSEQRINFSKPSE